jgi:hypothetical protein
MFSGSGAIRDRNFRHDAVPSENNETPDPGRDRRPYRHPALVSAGDSAMGSTFDLESAVELDGA